MRSLAGLSTITVMARVGCVSTDENTGARDGQTAALASVTDSTGECR